MVRDERDTIGWICWMSTGVMSNIDGSFLSCVSISRGVRISLYCFLVVFVSLFFCILFLLVRKNGPGVEYIRGNACLLACPVACVLLVPL